MPSTDLLIIKQSKDLFFVARKKFMEITLNCLMYFLIFRDSYEQEKLIDNSAPT